MIIFTSICANYGHKARTLAASVHRYMPGAKFILCLTEREVPDTLAQDRCFDRVVLSREMWDGNFDRFIFKHDIVEASTAVKGAFFQWLMKEYPADGPYIYLDPDCRVYADFPELWAALQEAPIVLCPHLLHPGNIDMELSSTAHGVYNLGFLAVDGSEEAHRLIDWWAQRLFLYCFDDMARGIFTDQRWMDLAPCFFHVKIMHHYGYDLAPWGLLGTGIEEKQPGKWMIQDMPLRFIHFSGFGPVAEQCMDKWLDETNQGFRKLYAEYAAEHAENDRDGISRTPWSYTCYESGERIETEVRHLYRENWDLMYSMENPFALSNGAIRAEVVGGSQPEAVKGSTEEERPARTLLGKKWQTARRVAREFGWQGIRTVIMDKVTGKEKRQ